MTLLGSQRTARVDLSVPMFGAWYADVEIETGAAPVPGSRLTLTVGDWSGVGTVLPGQVGEDFAAHPHLVIAAGVGWDAPLPPRAYQSDVGTRLSTVLRDLATDAGEAFAALPPDVSLGAAPVVRPGSAPGAPITGRSVLLGLWRAGYVPPWWVGGDGLTVLGQRPTGAAKGRMDIMRRDAGVGWKLLGIDAPTGFLPGLTIEGQVIRRLVVRETGSALSAEVWT